MAGAVTSGSFPKALQVGINKWFQTEYDDWPEEWSQMFTTENSEKQFEEDVGVSQFGLAGVKPEAKGIEYDDMEQNFVSRYEHRVFAKGFIITEEMWDDDQYGVAGKRGARALARSLRITKEVVHANVLNRAFNSAFTMGPNSDGKELCATDHPLGPYGGTASNELATPADVSESSLEDLLIQISETRDARNLQMMLQGVKVIVPVQEQFNIARILDSELRPGTADNDVNAIRQGNYVRDGYMVSHYLTDPDAWFILTNCPDGLKCFQRRPYRFGTDNDFDTSNAKFKADERYREGWSDWRGLFGSSGNT